jgi:hypothetical protein
MLKSKLLAVSLFIVLASSFAYAQLGSTTDERPSGS